MHFLGVCIPVTVFFSTNRHNVLVSVCKWAAVHGVAAKIWILWVPVSEQRDEIGYSDKGVELQARQEKKAPTSRVIQELKEQMVFTEDDVNLFDVSGVQVPSLTSSLSQPSGQLGNTGTGKRQTRRNGNSRGVIDLDPAPEQGKGPSQGAGRTPNIAIEAAKHKRNTVKELGCWNVLGWVYTKNNMNLPVCLHACLPASFMKLAGVHVLAL